jgi:cobalamin biosynthesis Mg chelatase CobN
VVRILGGYRAWEDGIDAVTAAGVPTVVVSGEQTPDAQLMERSTVPAGIALQTHLYLAHGGVENLRQLHAFLSDTLLMTGYGFLPPAASPTWGLLDRPARYTDGPTIAVLYYRAQRQRHLRRSAVRRDRKPWRPSAARVLRILAYRRAGAHRAIEHGGRHGGHRAGGRRNNTRCRGGGW